eukprot:CAMPEP_0176360982 /NCGR_PEP_ID=MMETSP0126-20121128/17424_1 /TAXON_ID=141414 ORGANISM="Strombidinopsis acuminatum, Strain SPMC142" /NCGR_SAMPLE_ID=MMETSP0126 /ASSEMBLY_ACC=CAM_ASM_000229 /LENGTH=48 /DNA_ID= /DNA_START= /DNA_END= /DNA_ORIENTATION=
MTEDEVIELEAREKLTAMNDTDRATPEQANESGYDSSAEKDNEEENTD